MSENDLINAPQEDPKAPFRTGAKPNFFIEKKDKQNNTFIIIVIIAVLLVVIGGLAGFLILNNDNDDNKDDDTQQEERESRNNLESGGSNEGGDFENFEDFFNSFDESVLDSELAQEEGLELLRQLGLDNLTEEELANLSDEELEEIINQYFLDTLSRIESGEELELPESSQIFEGVRSEMQQEALANAGSIGEPHEVGRSTWEITAVNDLGNQLDVDSQLIAEGYTNEDCIPSEDNRRFVEILMTATNTGRTQTNFFTPNFVIDEELNEYRQAITPFWCEDDSQIAADSLSTGESVSFIVIYEVPADTDNLFLEVSDYYFFTDVGDAIGYIDLSTAL